MKNDVEGVDKKRIIQVPGTGGEGGKGVRGVHLWQSFERAWIEKTPTDEKREGRFHRFNLFHQ